MLSWGVIAYGAALSAVAATVLVGFAGRERRPAVLACAAVSALLGAVGWNAILHATHADQFFHDAPIPVFPVSWQDTGSGVFSVAVAAGLRCISAARCAAYLAEHRALLERIKQPHPLAAKHAEEHRRLQAHIRAIQNRESTGDPMADIMLGSSETEQAWEKAADDRREMTDGALQLRYHPIERRS